MNKIKGFIIISAFSLMILCLPAIASAQYGNGGWNNGGYNNGNNNGGYNNGGYGNNNGYSRDIRSTVRDLKERAKNFEKMIDRDRNNNNNGGYNNGGYGNGGYNNGSYGNGSYNNGQYGSYGGYNNGGYNNGGYNNKDQRKALKRLADRFKDAADSLEDKYDNGRDMYKSADEARRVLDLGSQLEQALNNSGSSSYLRNEWNPIQRDLRIISDAYRYNNNNNGRGNNNGTWNNGNKPSWWPF